LGVEFISLFTRGNCWFFASEEVIGICLADSTGDGVEEWGGRMESLAKCF